MQTKVQHYRLPVFDRIKETLSERAKLTVLGHTNNGSAMGGGERSYIQTFELKSKFRMVYWSGLVSRISKEKPDHLLMTASPRNLSGWIIPIIRRIQGRKTVGWSKIYSDRLEREGWLLRLVKRSFYSLYGHMVVYGDSSRQSLLALLYPAKDITVAQNTIDTSYASEGAADIAVNIEHIKAMHDLDEKNIILFIGRLFPEKRPFDLLNAWESMAEGIENPCLVFVGSGPLLEELNDAVNRLGDDRIIVLGQVPHYHDYAWIKAAKCLVLSGQVGLAIQQAMVLGTPLVIADEQGVDSEIVVHGETGWRYEKGNLPALADTVVNVVNDRQKSMQVATAAKSLMENECSIDSMVGSIVSALDT